MDALIVASTLKQQQSLTEVLYRAKLNCLVCSTASEARRAVLCRTFDVFVINSGLADEHGNELALSISDSLYCGGVYIDDYARVERLEDTLNSCGIVALARPITKDALVEAVKLITACNARVREIKAKNDALSSKLEDIKYISRAKIVLMRTFGYTEEQAHKFIEKKAMDLRLPRRKVAVDILTTYEAI